MHPSKPAYAQNGSALLCVAPSHTYDAARLVSTLLFLIISRINTLCTPGEDTAVIKPAMLQYRVGLIPSKM
jgi:hypothetical protein